MPSIFFISKSLWQGKTMMRTVLDYRLKSLVLHGKVLDLGSGGSDQYTKFIPRDENTELCLFDKKVGKNVDFEKDFLPLQSDTYDVVLFMNVLEHIFNHRHILKEIYRVKKPNARLVGFVPFLKWYHADPRDFFRYTHEALEIIFTETGYSESKVVPLYIGPYSTAFDMILSTIPRFMRPVLYLPCYFLDCIFRKLRPTGAKRFVLGYYFECK